MLTTPYIRGGSFPLHTSEKRKGGGKWWASMIIGDMPENLRGSLMSTTQYEVNKLNEETDGLW